MIENNREHLGDGCYAELKNGLLTLTTSSGVGMSNSNTIYLEPNVYAALLEYVARMEARKG